MQSDRPSLRTRLLQSLLFPIIVASSLSAAVNHYAVVRFANIAYDRALEDSLRALASQIQHQPDHLELKLTDSAREILEYDPIDQVFFSVRNRYQQLLAGNAKLPYCLVNDPHVIQFRDIKYDHKLVRLAELKIKHTVSGQQFCVQIAETTQKRLNLEQEIFGYLLLPQILLFVVISLLLWYGIGRGLLPLRQISDALTQRPHLDLSPLDEEHVPAEVHEQIHAINHLMARLDQALSLRQRFIADASHQLRTPVTVLKTQAELAQRATTEAELRQAIEHWSTGIVRLERLVKQLLNLSRSESGSEREHAFKTLLLNDCLAETIAALVPAALKKHLDIQVHLPEEPLWIHGDETLLGEMVSNIVDNAIRYTPDGGQITIQLQHQQNIAQITVSDTGIGLPDADLERVFERFYRSAQTPSEGSGLGLAIAHDIAVLHHGSIRLSNRSEGGLQAMILLPLIKHLSAPNSSKLT